MSDSIYDINHRLIEKYGRDIATNEPRFRVVWTSTQLEKRYGEFEVFSEGGIFLREEKGVREEPKYLPEYPDLVHLSPSDLIRAEEAKMAKEKQNIKDMLSDETTDISFALKHGTAVTVGGNNGKDV